MNERPLALPLGALQGEDPAWFSGLASRLDALPVAEQHTIEPLAGFAFHLPAGAVLELRLRDGAQVVDLAAWCADPEGAPLSALRTQVLEGLWLQPLRRVWADVPVHRPMLIMLLDTVDDAPDLGGFHHFPGTHCSEELMALRTGRWGQPSCHALLTASLADAGLAPRPIGANLNLFQRLRVDPATGAMVAQPSTATRGDRVAFWSCMDQTVALSTCPNGDNSSFTGALEARGSAVEVLLRQAPEPPPSSPREPS